MYIYFYSKNTPTIFFQNFRFQPCDFEITKNKQVFKRKIKIKCFLTQSQKDRKVSWEI